MDGMSTTAVAVTKESVRFMALPSELRIRVYKEIAPTTNGNPEDVKCLRLTSRQIKLEFDHEYVQQNVRKMKRLVTNLPFPGRDIEVDTTDAKQANSGSPLFSLISPQRTFQDCQYLAFIVNPLYTARNGFIKPACNEMFLLNGLTSNILHVTFNLELAEWTKTARIPIHDNMQTTVNLAATRVRDFTNNIRCTVVRQASNNKWVQENGAALPGNVRIGFIKVQVNWPSDVHVGAWYKGVQARRRNAGEIEVELICNDAGDMTGISFATS